ncbi:trypsin-like serine protease [Saccharopolyspora rhizosphaerae]|uniref:Trypsin-like serine protease n=1 Tax=Saccharopolyspora rhizosphaerae TaxID=2492662 RepID=A0A3R8QPF3_9PSEU|nr:trypsin-like serine protease [Saccharopolyspora rhizosphaerae]RRO16879.1 trypsin-like serine protease [Saccharopolyspora rhizosphaerae]
MTPVLQQAQLPLVSDEDCERAALHGSPHQIWFHRAHVVCAGYERGGVASSAGHSVGPLVVAELAGITGAPVPRG